jgi:DNA-binding NtrC family response regulator
MNGLDLTDRLVALLPGIRVLLISGYTDEKSRWPEITQRGRPFLQKPFPMAELLQAIHRQLTLRAGPTPGS